MRSMIAALSFEERCLASAKRAIADAEADEITFLDYGASATPGSEAATIRDRHWKEIEALSFESGVHCSRWFMNGRSMDDMEDVLAAKSEAGSDDLVVDITCMTRPHVLAAAAHFASMATHVRWSVTYTTPLSYGDLDISHRGSGWIDTLWLPLGKNPDLGNQGLAVGLILAGHEADRTAIAFDEIGPGAGMVVVPVRADRPDLYRVAIQRNRPLFSYLRSLRMPGERGRAAAQFIANGGWEFKWTRMEVLADDLWPLVRQVVSAARDLESPIVFVPFGPKNVVFVAAWFLAREWPDRSWGIYPVPSTHPINYSDGVLRTDKITKDQLESLRAPTVTIGTH